MVGGQHKGARRQMTSETEHLVCLSLPVALTGDIEQSNGLAELVRGRAKVGGGVENEERQAADQVRPAARRELAKRRTVQHTADFRHGSFEVAGTSSIQGSLDVDGASGGRWFGKDPNGKIDPSRAQAGVPFRSLHQCDDQLGTRRQDRIRASISATGAADSKAVRRGRLMSTRG